MWLGKCVTDVHHFSLNGVMHAFLKKRKKLEKMKKILQVKVAQFLEVPFSDVMNSN